MFTTACDNHRFRVAFQFAQDVPTKMLDNYLDFLAYGRRVQGRKARNTPLPAPPVQFGIILDGLFELIVGLIGHVILENVQDEPFLDGLTH